MDTRTCSCEQNGCSYLRIDMMSPLEGAATFDTSECGFCFGVASKKLRVHVFQEAGLFPQFPISAGHDALSPHPEPSLACSLLLKGPAESAVPGSPNLRGPGSLLEKPALFLSK